MATINPSKRMIYIADSKRLYANDFIILFKKLESEMTEFIFGNETITWQYMDLSNDIPYQRDGSSCGPLSVINADYLVRNQPFNYEIDAIITTLRFNVCISIILQDYAQFL